jgi:hypothetical protein
VSHRWTPTKIQTLSATAGLIEAFARCVRCQMSAAQHRKSDLPLKREAA